LANHNFHCALLLGDSGDGSCVHSPRDMLEHRQWAGDGARRIAYGDAKILAAWIYCKDSHALIGLDHSKFTD